MGEKDLAEKLMEDYPDVFADIVNVLLFGGRQIVLPQELMAVGLQSQFKADTGKAHEQERDVAKYWIRDGQILALIGLENQTSPDKDMPMRIAAYDGSSYKSQLLNNISGHCVTRYPVITLVLYFGEKPWGASGRSLRGMFRNPEHLEPYIKSHPVHIFQIAYLSEEQLRLFRSDFGFLAEFMVCKRKNEPFRISSDRKIVHVDAVLKMLSVFAQEEYVNKLSKEIVEVQRKGGCVMGCNVSEAWVNLGRAEGMQKGIQEGIQEGMREERDKMNALITGMLRDGRIEELQRSVSDREFQEQLLREYGVDNT